MYRTFLCNFTVNKVVFHCKDWNLSYFLPFKLHLSLCNAC